jgi:hypothetical protein
MAEITFITALGGVLLPLALLVWLRFGTDSHRIEWLLQTLGFYAYLALIAVAGTWLLVPWYLPHGYALCGAWAAAQSWRKAGRCERRPHVRTPSVVRIASSAALAVFCLGTLIWALSGYRPPPGPSLRLASPLKGGTFYVLNGGYSILINPHMKTLTQESLSGYRAQSYAIDLVRIDRFGRRAEGLWPQDLNQYHIFGEPVYAPCTGRVAHAEGRLPDRPPSETDREHPAGNFVRLACDEADVLLAHLMQFSLEVDSGEWVRTGQRVGRVGNSGLSLEPHLHLHAQQRGPEGNFLAATPVPVEIDGRILVRNSRLNVPGF